jgi:hypothetical protein
MRCARHGCCSLPGSFHRHRLPLHSKTEARGELPSLIRLSPRRSALSRGLPFITRLSTERTPDSTVRYRRLLRVWVIGGELISRSRSCPERVLASQRDVCRRRSGLGQGACGHFSFSPPSGASHRVFSIFPAWTEVTDNDENYSILTSGSAEVTLVHGMTASLG